MRCGDDPKGPGRPSAITGSFQGEAEWWEADLGTMVMTDDGTSDQRERYWKALHRQEPVRAGALQKLQSKGLQEVDSPLREGQLAETHVSQPLISRTEGDTFALFKLLSLWRIVTATTGQ